MKANVKSTQSPSAKIVEANIKTRQTIQRENHYDNRTVEEIQQSIDQINQDIQEKTSLGKTLSKAVSEQVSPDTFLKLQRFEIFLNKMEELYRSEISQQKKTKKKVLSMRQSPVYSQTPLKDILKGYNDLTTRGFEAESLGKSLEQVFKALHGRGHKAKVMNDYGISELDQSWKMQKVCDDLKFAITEDNKDLYTGGQLLNPYHLGKISNYLGDIGYKNSELIQMQLEKLEHQLNVNAIRNRTVDNSNTSFSLEQQIYGSFKNYMPRHYIFQGFQSNKEFQEYLQILLEWQSEKDKNYVQKLKKRGKLSVDQEVLEIQQAIGDLIETAIKVKEFQKEHLASIESLREQFFKLQQATDKHEFLTQNPYIKYDILELQELLVNGGFINPDEIPNAQKLIKKESLTEQMERASQVFYDYVLNYEPEFLSPQYEQFYQTAVEQKEKLNIEQKINVKTEKHNQLNLKFLSQALIGISKQALSYRRDVVRKDYLNQFYEEYLMPFEKQNNTADLQHINYEYVLMEREYLKSWVIFQEKVFAILPTFCSMVKESIENNENISSLLYAISALNECKIDEAELRDQMVQKCLQQLKGTHLNAGLTNEQRLDGLKAIARSPHQNSKLKELGNILINKVEIADLSFLEQLDLLWNICAIGNYDNKIIQTLIHNINNLPFERVDNELGYQEYQKITDIYHALEVETPSSNQKLKITNSQLVGAIKGAALHEMKYNETKLYDPFKDKVLAGLSKGLAAASIEHTQLIENQLFYNTEQEVENLSPSKYPYKPDIVMGYQGKKVGIFVLSEQFILSDSKDKDGIISFRMRLIEKAHNSQISCVFIPVTKVVKYDLQKFKLSFNENFNLMNEINNQLGNNISSKQIKINEAFSKLTALSSQITKQSIEAQSVLNDVEIQKMAEFLQMISKLYHLKHTAELKYDKIQKNAAFDEVKLTLLKISLMLENLPQQCQQIIKNSSQPKESFKNVLLKIKDSLKDKNNNPDQKYKSDENVDHSWIGTRLEVELPVSSNEKLRKSIVPEIINQRFMWVDDYFHYDDWKQKQQATFDNFSLLVIPHNKDAPKHFFDRSNHQRRIPQGIFPNPNKKRTILLPTSNLAAQQLADQSGNDEFVLFEKEPYKMMVVKELKKSEQLEPISNEVSLITNLQNLKQSLKSDYSDVEILRIVLLNLNFTDKLIEEHLSLNKKSEVEKKGLFLERDPHQYRQFQSKQYFSKDREDPFTDFYIREAAKKQRIYDAFNKEKEYLKEDEQDSNIDEVERSQERQKRVQNLIEKMLLQQEDINEDMNSLSHALSSNIKINYDLKSLMKTEFVFDVDPEITDGNLSDSHFLDRQRRRAEQKLIKMKIIYKLYDELAGLTPNEKLYLAAWKQDLLENKERNLLNLRDSLLPAKPTDRKIVDMDAKTFYALNSLANVSFNRELHGEYSINEIVLELSNFLDEEVVDKVQLDVFSKRLSAEWDLPSDFQLVETRNKEIGIVLNELEEVFYRMSGMFNDKDYENLVKMLSVKRGKDHFDKQFYDNDMKSLKEFMCDANYYDQRIKLLEAWVVRKEDEMKKRVVMPNESMKKSDKEIHAKFEKDWKKARESLVSKLLSKDEYGTSIKKSYKEMTSKELGIIAQNLAIRLYVFNYEYPQFLQEIVKGVLEHPNLLNSDKMLLETYCKMFELDWRGDLSYANKQELLSYRPMYMHGDNIKAYMSMEQDDIRKLIKTSCGPYVEEVSKKVIAFN